VNSGRSSFDIFNIQAPVPGQLNDTVIIPLHSTAVTVPGPGLPNPPIITFSTINGLQAQAIGFPFLAKEIQDSIATNAQSFSNNAPQPQIKVRQVNPGEMLVRCSQNGSREPGLWWTFISDMPLSILGVRNGIAVLPNWNQDGNLEFFVVPEGCNMIVLEGIASDQRLPEAAVNTTPGPVWTADGNVTNVLGNPVGGDPRSIPNPVWDPTFHGNMLNGIKRSAKFIKLNPGDVFGQGVATVLNLAALVNTDRDVTGQYLVGGCRQIFIVNGGANFQNYVPCIALIVTGYLVEI
jgi:hypothetical protein